MMKTSRSGKRSPKEQIPFIKRAGKDYVKSQMERWQLREYLKGGKIGYAGKFKEYPVSVNDTWFFTEADAYELELGREG